VTIDCEILRDADGEAWQAYAESRPGCGLYHHLAWKAVVENAYGHRMPYLVARQSGRICGVLPLALTRSRIFGSALTSLPFLDHSGVVADTQDARVALAERARELGVEFGVDVVELRQLEPVDESYPTSTEKVLMTLELTGDEDSMWSALPSERRNRVRRAGKQGLTVEAAGAEALPVFYDIWTHNMRDLGSPPHSRRFFDEILRRFEGLSSLFLVMHEGRPIGAALALHWKGLVTVPWVSSLRDYFKLYPNNILYWELMRYAIARGITTFDFGRSTRDSGTYQFKARWGARPKPLAWQFLHAGAGSSAGGGTSAAFDLAIEVWKRLPVALTRWIGPALRRSITA
jgi:FemAB-related protein (PEP-CTERM system-associated)